MPEDRFAIVGIVAVVAIVAIVMVLGNNSISGAVAGVEEIERAVDFQKATANDPTENNAFSRFLITPKSSQAEQKILDIGIVSRHRFVVDGKASFSADVPLN